MGTRINVEFGPKGLAAMVLFSNSHHPDVDAEALVREAVKEFPGNLSFIGEKLLSLRYPSMHLGHKEGDRVFSIDMEPGDREKVLRIQFGANFQLEVFEEAP